MYRVFYVLYNYYYEDGNNKKEIPIVTVYFLVVLWLFCLCLLLDNIIVLLQNPYSRETNISQTASYFIAGILSAVVYYALVYKRKYQAIYDRYKDDPFLNKKAGKVMGWFIVIGSILSPFIFALIKNKIVFGSWV